MVRRKVLVLLLLLAAFCAFFTMIGNIRLGTDIAEVENNIAIEQGKTRFQQAEYDEYAAELPIKLKEYEEIAPKAEAAMALVDAFKQERKAYREQIKADAKALEEIEALKAKIAELQKELDAANGV